MKILHLCSDFANQSIYSNLIEGLSTLGIKQEIYIPVRTQNEVGKYQNNSLSEVRYYYSHILNKFDRVFYYSKIKKTTNDLLAKVNCEEIHLCHAHFLFSDGGIALNLKRKYNIPYIVAVRNTDLNIFFKYLFFLRKTGIEILKNASKVIFLSPSYQTQLFERYVPETLKEQLLSISEIVPNGVDEFWHENAYSTKIQKINNPIRLLYVGDFSKNKNVHLIIKACRYLNKNKIPVKINIVGGGGGYEKKVKKLIRDNSSFTSFDGRIVDKGELLKRYRTADIFVMPSSFETFGLVYAEALTQGLPIVYTIGQGVFGYFDEGRVGYGIHSHDHDYKQLAKVVIKIKDNYPNMVVNCIESSRLFSWRKICDLYNELYFAIDSGGN